MARYKYGEFLEHSEHSVYDTLYAPGEVPLIRAFIGAKDVVTKLPPTRETLFPLKIIISTRTKKLKFNGSFWFSRNKRNSLA